MSTSGPDRQAGEPSSHSTDQLIREPCPRPEAQEEAVADRDGVPPQLTFAASPVSWGVDFPDAEDIPPPSEVLPGMARLGFTALELGPVGYLPGAPETLRPLLARNRLSAVGTWLILPLTTSLSTGSRRHAERTVDFVCAAGGQYLIVIDAVEHPRSSTAGNRDRAARTALRDWDHLIANLVHVLEIADERQLTVVFHPHVGTHIEFEDEIETLLQRTADLPLGLCVDTGHCAYAGFSGADLVARHAGRVHHLHLKDVDEQARTAALSDRLDFWSAVAYGIFCPLGDGIVDLPSFLAAAASSSAKYATLEQDTTPGKPAAAAAALKRSITAVRDLVRHSPSMPGPQRAPAEGA